MNIQSNMCIKIYELTHPLYEINNKIGKFDCTRLVCINIHDPIYNMIFPISETIIDIDNNHQNYPVYY